jgi:twitching motility two-component system response regulator PilG
MEQGMQPGAEYGSFYRSGVSRMQTNLDPTDTPEVPSHSTAESDASSPPDAEALSGLKVMVIDDSKTIRRTAETLLKKEGCEVVTATDGYQTCALIKNNRVLRQTPVVMLSSKDGLFDRARGRIVGSDQYLTKPFTKEELLGAIRRHVHL